MMDGKDLRPHLIQTFLENVNRGSRNYGSWRLISVYGDPLLRDGSYLGVACKDGLECQTELETIMLGSASKKAREYLQCDY